MSTMTYAQAQKQAVELRSQGLTFPKIEQRLRTAGYKSPKTKEPITALAVRHMISRYEEDQKFIKTRGSKPELEDKKMFVITDAKSIETEIETLLSVEGLSDKVKNQLAIALIKAKREEDSENQNLRVVKTANSKASHVE